LHHTTQYNQQNRKWNKNRNRDKRYLHNLSSIRTKHTDPKDFICGRINNELHRSLLLPPATIHMPLNCPASDASKVQLQMFDILPMLQDWAETNKKLTLRWYSSWGWMTMWKQEYHF
jgi:hypothetical protein